MISISNQCAKTACPSDNIRGEFPQTCSLETKSVSDADAPMRYCSSMYSNAQQESELSLHVVWYIHIQLLGCDLTETVKIRDCEIKMESRLNLTMQTKFA